MNEGLAFPKKAAYFSLAASVIAYAIALVSERVYSGSGILRPVGYFFSITILATGLVLGIYALFYFRKIKGILPLASIGLVFNTLATVIICQSFITSRNDFVYYEIQSVMKSERVEFKQTILGRIHRGQEIHRFLDEIRSGLLGACPKCEITDTKIHEKVPVKFTGIFNNSHIGFTYVAIDTDEKDVGDIRFIFPELAPQPSCSDLAGYIEIQKRKFDQVGTVTCIEAQKN